MKEFLISKINAILSIILVGVLGTGGYLGYNVLVKGNNNTVPDFLGKDKSEVITWCGSLSIPDACEFVYEDTTNTETDKVFQQSISAGNKLTDKITFKISSGIIKQVEVIQVNENTSKDDIEKWKNENEISVLNYVEENSETVEKGKIIRIEPTENIEKQTPVTVYVSSGKKEEKKEADSKTIEINSGAYLGLSVSEFEEKMKALGLKPNHRSSNDAESSTVKKGNIVWHGSGTYEKDETINYGICIGEVTGIAVKQGAYVGKSEADFKTAAESLGLKAVHNKDWDEKTSVSSKVGTVCRHGYSNNYEKGEDLRYGLYVSDSSSSSESKYIVITSSQFINKSEAELKSAVESLGLVPYHNADWDKETNDKDKVGTVCRHGYSENYTKGENLRYGLYKSSSSSSVTPSQETNYIIITSGQYNGKTEAEIKSAAEHLGLVPYHNSEWDQNTNDKSKEGTVCRHGFANNYVKGENLRYGLYKYVEVAQTVTVENKSGLSESEFKSYVEGLGMKLGTRSEGYSSSVAQGLIISNDSGSYEKGSSINYKVSLGAEPEATASIMRAENYGPLIKDTYEATKAALANTFSSFSNVEFIEATSNKAVGQLEKIEVNGNESYEAGQYPLSTSIKVYIVAVQNN